MEGGFKPGKCQSLDPHQHSDAECRRPALGWGAGIEEVWDVVPRLQPWPPLSFCPLSTPKQKRSFSSFQFFRICTESFLFLGCFWTQVIALAPLKIHLVNRNLGTLCEPSGTRGQAWPYLESSSSEETLWSFMCKWKQTFPHLVTIATYVPW